jgi:phi LC3 family holin
MNIDWKARITHKAWWIGIVSLVVLLSQQLGFDLTLYIPKNYADIINTVFAILVALGVSVDTSTPTINDASTENKEGV